MPYSTFQIAGTLNYLWGGQAFPAPTTLRLFLSTADPGVSGTGRLEPGGGGYAQVVIANNATTWPTVAGSPKANGIDISFPVATGPWGTITHVGIDDGDGNFRASAALAVPRVVVAGDLLSFPAGTLLIGLA